MRGRRPRATKSGSLFRGHRAGDTGELEPVRAEIPEGVGFAIPSDPIQDPESARYAPRAPGPYAWLTRLLALAIIIGVLWVVGAGAWSWSQDQYFIGEQDGSVVIYRGVNASLPGIDLSSPYEKTNVTLDRLSDFQADQVREGIDASSLGAARRKVENLAGQMAPEASP
jgi:protein phosphatase